MHRRSAAKFFSLLFSSSASSASRTGCSPRSALAKPNGKKKPSGPRSRRPGGLSASGSHRFLEEFHKSFPKIKNRAVSAILQRHRVAHHDGKAGGTYLWDVVRSA